MSYFLDSLVGKAYLRFEAAALERIPQSLQSLRGRKALVLLLLSLFSTYHSYRQGHSEGFNEGKAKGNEEGKEAYAKAWPLKAAEKIAADFRQTCLGVEQSIDTDKDWPARILGSKEKALLSVKQHAETLDNMLTNHQEDMIAVENIVPECRASLVSIREKCSQLREEVVNKLREMDGTADMEMRRKEVRAILQDAAKFVLLAK